MTIETQTIEGLKALRDAVEEADAALDMLADDAPASQRAERKSALDDADKAYCAAMHSALPVLLANAERQVEMIAALTGQAQNAEIEIERLRAENREISVALVDRAFASAQERVRAVEFIAAMIDRWSAAFPDRPDAECCTDLALQIASACASLALHAPAQAEPVCYCDTHGSRLECEDAGTCAMTLDGKAIATKLAWRSTEYDPPADDEEVLMYCPCRDTPSNPERIELGVFRTSRGSQHSWATLWAPRPAFPTLAAPPPPAGEG